MVESACNVSLGSISQLERSLEEETASPSDNLAWEIPRIEEPEVTVHEVTKGLDMTELLTLSLIKSITIPEALTLKYYLANHGNF